MLRLVKLKSKKNRKNSSTIFVRRNPFNFTLITISKCKSSPLFWIGKIKPFILAFLPRGVKRTLTQNPLLLLAFTLSRKLNAENFANQSLIQ